MKQLIFLAFLISSSVSLNAQYGPVNYHVTIPYGLDHVMPLQLGDQRVYVVPEPRAARLGQLAAEGYECRILRDTLQAMADRSLLYNSEVVDSVNQELRASNDQLESLKDSIGRLSQDAIRIERERDRLHEGWIASEKQARKFSRKAKRRARLMGVLVAAALAGGIFLGGQ